MTDTVAIVIPVFEADRTRQLVAAIPPDYRALILVPGGADVPGAQAIPASGASWAAGCAAALAWLEANKKNMSVSVVCTLDSRCDPTQISRLIAPLMSGNASLVLGSRRMRKQAPGALSFPTLARNWLACRAIQLLTGKVYTDITPFRAMTYDAFKNIASKGLTASQFRAPRLGLKPAEVPVDYRK